jgi:hypothetical protein
MLAIDNNQNVVENKIFKKVWFYFGGAVVAVLFMFFFKK